MSKNWFLLFDQERSSDDVCSMDPLLPNSMGAQWLYDIASIVESSRYICLRGSLVLTEAFSCVSKFAGALVIRFSSGSKSWADISDASTKLKYLSALGHDLSCSTWESNFRRRNPILVIGKISSFALRKLCKEAERLQSLPVLALSASILPSFTNFSSNVLASPMEASSTEAQRYMDQRPCEVETRSCRACSEFIRNITWSKTVEPRTGVEFPTMLDNSSLGESDYSFTPEVLVGTGSRIMTFVRIKSLKVYAFGFYVHPFDVCEKLGRKYSCIPDDDLKSCNDFYDDLLREDINMTVRLVVNYNGIKINTVKEVFEKSLRARLTRMNPQADFSCLQDFGSFFTPDIPLQVGTTINFHRTTDGHLITEVGGNNIGAVQSKDLCRAFFDMYIGHVPICEKTKEEIGKNVASIIRTC